MARNIVVSRNGVESSFGLNRLRREQLYRTRRRRVLDARGEPTVRAELTDDGEILLRPGMTNQGYFDDEGHPVSASELIARRGDEVFDGKGESTLGKPVPLEGPVTAEEVLDLRPKAVYLLDPESVDPALLDALKAGDVFRFPFSYTASWENDTAMLLANDEGVFALVGAAVETRPWSELDKLVPDAGDDDEDDDLDFDFF